MVKESLAGSESTIPTASDGLTTDTPPEAPDTLTTLAVAVAFTITASAKRSPMPPTPRLMSTCSTSVAARSLNGHGVAEESNAFTDTASTSSTSIKMFPIFRVKAGPRDRAPPPP